MYVDAILDKNADKIVVVERDAKGQRQFKEWPANYTMYYADAKGKQRSIFGDPVTKFSTRKRTEFEKERRIHSGKKVFESDVNVVFRCLSENYLGQEAPKLHTCFFDIETDWQHDEIKEDVMVRIRKK